MLYVTHNILYIITTIYVVCNQSSFHQQSMRDIVNTIFEVRKHPR